MNWLKKFIERLFFRNKIKMIEPPKVIEDIKENKNKFITDLKRQADIELSDGNGYRIIQNRKLEDMV